MLYEKIKEMAAQRKVSIAELERTLDFPNGMISKWTTASPNSANLYKVAKYFGVSMESLVGEEREVTKDAETRSGES